MAPSYIRIVFAEQPKGAIDSNAFRIEEAPLDLKPANDEVLLKIHYLSIDPAMRLWINDAEGNYVVPVRVGETMRSVGIATVIEAGANSGLSVGDRVSGQVGLNEYSVVKAKPLVKVDLPNGADLLDVVGPLGHPGVTAYLGIIETLKIKAGETLVVTGAAGAVGSLACQLARAKGAKVYGIAGSEEKCRYLEEELGIAKAFNYKSPTFRDDFVRDVGTFDVAYDLAGGEILDFLLGRLNVHARVLLTGSTSTYNGQSFAYKSMPNIWLKRARVEGFGLPDHAARIPEIKKILEEKVARGALKFRYHVVEGIREAPNAIGMLFRGENNGKLVVKVSEE